MTNQYTVRYTDGMDNRTVILEQALNLFSERGCDAVGVQEICDMAGITKPTLYHYFGSKRGLLEAILEQYFSELKKRLSAAADYHGDLPLTLQIIAETYFAFAVEFPVFYRLQLALWFAPQESEGFKAVILQNRFQHEMIEKVFLAAVLQHGNMGGRHQAYALTFLGMLNTYIGLGLNGLASLDVELARQAVRQFQYGIYS